MTAESAAIDYCHGLFGALKAALLNTASILASCEQLKARGLAPTFPEVRFCKGSVLPVVDEFTTNFLEARCGAGRGEIRAALRCEGFQTLADYFEPSHRMSGYSGSPWNRDRVAQSKSGNGSLSGANPDFCVRFSGKCSLRLVGEVKFLPQHRTSTAAIDQVAHELHHYLSIKSSSHSDWAHDFGFGLVYCGGGSADRKAELVQDAWDSKRFMIAYMHA